MAVVFRSWIASTSVVNYVFVGWGRSRANKRRRLAHAIQLNPPLPSLVHVYGASSGIENSIKGLCGVQQ